MKFKDIREHYYTVTGKASDVARQLAFAGFAAIWVFRQGSSGVRVPPPMFMAAGIFGLALIADVLQYGIAAHLWRREADDADKVCEKDEDERDVAETVNSTPRFFFALKLWLVGAGYAWYVGAIVFLILAE